MKKVLFSLLAVSACTMVFSQTLVSENFESLIIGNVGTDVTGATEGQNGWLTAYGANADYQIANIDAAHGKSMTIASYNSFSSAANTTLNTRVAIKQTSVEATTSNNILHGRFDLYTGPSTGTGTIQMRVIGDNDGESAAVGGFIYNVATKELRGIGTFMNLSTFEPTVYSIGLAAAPGIVLTANTWATLDFRYNKTTGACTWSWPGGSGSIAADTPSLGLIPGIVAQDVYLFNVTASGNTVSKIGGFDNILVEFTNTASLSTNDLSSFVKSTPTVKLYPNPTSDVLNIVADSKINSISVTDFIGRKMNVQLNNGKLDVSALSAGAYLITVETKNGITTEKFIKK